MDSLYRGSVAKRPDVAIDEEPDAVCHVADAAVAGHRVLLAAAVFLAAAAAAAAAADLAECFQGRAWAAA